MLITTYNKLRASIRVSMIFVVVPCYLQINALFCARVCQRINNIFVSHTRECITNSKCIIISFGVKAMSHTLCECARDFLLWNVNEYYSICMLCTENNNICVCVSPQHSKAAYRHTYLIVVSFCCLMLCTLVSYKDIQNT